MNVWTKRIGVRVRKTAAILCLVCLLSCLCIGRVSGAGNTAITVASCTAEQDSIVSVTVRLDGNPGLWGLKLRIGYDSSAMTLNAVDTGSLFSEDELACSESLSKNPYVIVASRGKLENLTGDGVLVTLRFSVKANAEQKGYPVTVEIVQAVNVAGEDVDIDAANGIVTVVECLHGGKQWVTTEAAACEKAGTQVLTCRKCAATFESRSLPATGHQHTEVRGAVAATQTQTGYSGDTYCTDCGKQIDQGMTIEKLSSDTQPAETKPVGTQPQITSGDHASFRKDFDIPLIFVSDAKYQDFIRVEVDGVTLSADHYTVKSGSTIVTVSQDYLKTLDAGSHTLSIVSKTGTATASFTIEEAAAQPGENEAAEPVPPDGGSASGNRMIIIVIVVCLLCAAGLAMVIVTKNRRGKYAKKDS